MVYTSKQNPIIKKISSLRQKKYRSEFGEFIVEGAKQVSECLSSDLVISLVVVADDFVFEAACKTIIVSRAIFNYLSEEVTPQGVLAVVKIPVAELKKPSDKCLLLDRVSDPGNLGTIIRTANAAGYGELYLLDCADAYGGKCVRAAMSGLFFIKVYTISFSEIDGVFGGYQLLCADMKGECVYGFKAESQHCIVVGNEANGVSDELAEKCNAKIAIPMRQCAESLNVAVSAGILMYTVGKIN